FPAAQRGAVLGSAPGAGNLVTNGSFETGTFSGWTTATTGSPFRPWAVNGAGFGGGFGLLTTQPQGGSLAAWHGVCRAGPTEYTMTQDIALAAGQPLSLTWKDRLQWNFFTAGAQPRTYFVEVLNPVTNALLGTLYSLSTGTTPVNVPENTGWL